MAGRVWRRGSELGFHVERGAGFRGKFAVAVDRGAGKPEPEQEYERFEGDALRGGACVLGRASVGGHSADVADADAVRVVALAVCPGLFEWAARVYGAVQVDDVVVAHVAEALGLVPAADVVGRERAAFGGGGAVDDDFVDGTHDGEFFRSLRNEGVRKGGVEEFQLFRVPFFSLNFDCT